MCVRVYACAHIVCTFECVCACVDVGILAYTIVNVCACTSVLLFLRTFDTPLCD
jgi:hypothetical protein